MLLYSIQTLSSMNKISSIVLVLGGVYTLHWTSVQFYSSYCAPPGFSGIVTSILQSASPLCIATTYIQFYTAQTYYSAWLAIILGSMKLAQTTVDRFHKATFHLSGTTNTES